MRRDSGSWIIQFFQQSEHKQFLREKALMWEMFVIMRGLFQSDDASFASEFSRRENFKASRVWKDVVSWKPRDLSKPLSSDAT